MVTLSAWLMCNRNASTEPADSAEPAREPGNLTPFSLKHTVEHLNSNPDRIKHCWTELSAEQQVVDMWHLLTPSPVEAPALSTYYHAVVRYRVVSLTLRPGLSDY